MSKAERIISRLRPFDYTFEMTSTIDRNEIEKYSGIFVRDGLPGLNDLSWAETAHGDTFEEVVANALKMLIPDLTPEEVCAIIE